jgi:hypothetical protein
MSISVSKVMQFKFPPNHYFVMNIFWLAKYKSNQSLGGCNHSSERVRPVETKNAPKIACANSVISCCRYVTYSRHVRVFPTTCETGSPESESQAFFSYVDAKPLFPPFAVVGIKHACPGPISWKHPIYKYQSTTIWRCGLYRPAFIRFISMCP